jgi:hypothetical protein
MQDLRYARSAPRGVTLPKDVARHEANRVNNERQQARRHRTWLRSAARTPARACGGGEGETPSESESSGDDDVEEDEDKEEGEITPSCQSPPSP